MFGQTVTDYDKSGIDYRQHHTIMGPGGGQDLVYQNGKFFTSFGRQIEPTPANLKKAGIPLTQDINNFLKRHELQTEHDRLKKQLEEQMADLEKKEKARIMRGFTESPTAMDKSDEADFEEQLGQIDMSGIDELSLDDEPEEEEVILEPEPVAKKPVSRPTIKAKAKAKRK